MIWVQLCCTASIIPDIAVIVITQRQRVVAFLTTRAFNNRTHESIKTKKQGKRKGTQVKIIQTHRHTSKLRRWRRMRQSTVTARKNQRRNIEERENPGTLRSNTPPHGVCKKNVKVCLTQRWLHSYGYM